MSAVKKRKLNGAVASAPLSAVAARRATAQAAVNTADEAVTKDMIPLVSSGSVTANGKRKPRENVSESAEGKTPRTDQETASTPLRLEEELLPSVDESRAASPELPIQRPSITFSTLKPSKNTIKELGDGALVLRLEPGERLVILGQFEISVKKGQVTLLGSTLQSSRTSYRVYAPSSHSLPVIRCASTEVGHAEVRLWQCHTGLDSMKTISALFGSLWNDESGLLGWEHSRLLKDKGKSSFQILFTSQDGPPKSFLQTLISPPEWNEALSRLSENALNKSSSIMLCGPKSSGKSTFAKILGNRLLPTVQGSKGVAILDLDPGQPEYSPPGQLSLIHIQEPNFGPSFSHPTPGGKGKIIRSHAIGSITPSLDPSLYMACALDLYIHYRNFLQTTPNWPLIINTAGWVLGTGLEILVELITKIHPTQILYMSLDGPSDVVDSLREAAGSIPLLTLPSQGSEYATRTAAHLRTMSNMSYFHLNPINQKEKGVIWNDTPLFSLPPWQVGYSGEESGILGIMCYGEQPPGNLVAETINGSLVSIVVIDDMAALPGWNSSQEQENLKDDNDLHILEASTFHPTHLEKPLLVQSPEGLPYFNPANSISLDSRYSHAIGLALVRGIDVERKCLQILTPIPSEVVSAVIKEGKKIVLVSGKLDTPGWAYTESFMQADFRAKEGRRREHMAVDVEAEEGSSGEEEETGKEDEDKRTLGKEFRDAPWVERLHGSQGRGVGARVWRVRRDLGRGEGGD